MSTMEDSLSKIYDLLYRLGVTANYTGFFHTAGKPFKPQINYPIADPISPRGINVLTFLHSAYMDKGTGRNDAYLQPQRANGACLPNPVSLSAI